MFLVLLSASFGNLRGYKFENARDAEYSEKAVLVFDASIEVLKREHRDQDGFKVSDKAAIKTDTFNAKKDIFAGDLVAFILYLVKFERIKLVKGDESTLEGLRWAYSNSTLSMCPHYPRALIQGKRYRFYVRSVSDQRGYGIKLLEAPSNKQIRSEQDGARQPATAVDSKSESSEKPKSGSEGRSQ